MEDKIKLLNHSFGLDRVKSNVDISEHVVTRFGGHVAAFFIATTKRELIKVVEQARELKIEFIVIGQGSKVAFAISGYQGLVIKNRVDLVKISGIKGKVSPGGIGVEEAFLEADSGVSLNGLCEFSQKQNLTGFEGLQNSVGSVGGNMWLNPILHKYTHKVEVLDKFGEIEVKDLAQITKEDIILAVVFKLKSKSR